ncbi:hypothetical protein HZC34_01335 [Candidatus Saganbacteria bacterium]|nr:hypothetical protein [Candidatus Saganbacteria bacterium]
MKKLISIIYLLMLAFTANAAIIGSTDDAMTVGGGARPIGMGKAFVAVSDDADAPFINPAGLASLKGPQAMSMFTNLLNEVYYMEYSGAVPTPYGTIGAGYITTGVNNIPTTPPTDYYDSLFLVSYSTPLGRFFRYGKNIFVGANRTACNASFRGRMEAC